MALTDVILKKGEVVLSLTTTGLGVYGIGSNIDFGAIELLSQVSNRNVGEIVSFDKEKSTQFQITGETGVFYLTTENNIGFSETIIP